MTAFLSLILCKILLKLIQKKSMFLLYSPSGDPAFTYLSHEELYRVGLYEHMAYQSGNDWIIEVSNLKPESIANESEIVEFYKDKEYIVDKKQERIDYRHLKSIRNKIMDFVTQETSDSVVSIEDEDF